MSNKLSITEDVGVSYLKPLSRNIIYAGTATPQGGGGTIINNQDITITENGVYTASAGYTGIGTATVALPLGAKSITANDTYIALDEGLQGYSSVTVNVTPVLSTLNATTNGTYTPTSPSVGFSSVVVNTVEADIVAATNTTGSSIASGDKVWLEKVAGGYNAIQSVIRNYAIKGSLTDNNKVISGFTINDYIMLFNAFNPSSNTWEVRMAFTTGNDLTGQQYIFKSGISAPSQAGRFGISFFINGTNFGLDVSTTGTSWDVSSTGTHTVLANTKYYVKFGWTGTEYYFEYSTDGVTYTRDITVSSTSGVYGSLGLTLIGVTWWNDIYDVPFLGSIDLSETYIETNGSLWWCPYGVFDNPKILSGFAEDAIATLGTGQVKTALGNYINIEVTADADDAEISVE